MLKVYTLIGFVLIFSACKPDSNSSMPTLAKGQKMDSVFFWKIMDYAFEQAGFDNSEREELIIDQLTNLTLEQIQDFEIVFQQINRRSDNKNLHIALSIMDGVSDDTYYYFRCWLISIGKKHFEAALKDPDYLAGLEIPESQDGLGTPAFMFEELIGVSDVAYYKVSRVNANEENSPRAMSVRKGFNFDSYAPNSGGRDYSREELKKSAPKLYAKFGWDK